MKTGQFIHDRLGLIRWVASWDPGGAPTQAGTVHFYDPFDVWLGAMTFDARTHVQAISVADASAIEGALRWLEERGVFVQEESTPEKTLRRAVENWLGDAARNIAGTVVEGQ